MLSLDNLDALQLVKLAAVIGDVRQFLTKDLRQFDRGRRPLIQDREDSSSQWMVESFR